MKKIAVAILLAGLALGALKVVHADGTQPPASPTCPGCHPPLGKL